jgi:hypothetical protein
MWKVPQRIAGKLPKAQPRTAKIPAIRIVVIGTGLAKVGIRRYEKNRSSVDRKAVAIRAVVSTYMCVTAHTATAWQSILTVNRIAYRKGCSRYLRTRIDCNSTSQTRARPCGSLFKSAFLFEVFLLVSSPVEEATIEPD